mmetsp:Transcript_60432/g.88494  ORF Transcript_60432/g.88494 Transcript_60432/m.88494 type:complete len:80 (-) Transcript_60432:26-265(-)
MQNWRECEVDVLLWYSVARRTQQEKRQKVNLPAFSSIACQPQLFLYTKNAKNDEECEMRLLRGYGTRPRAAGNRRYTPR